MSIKKIVKNGASPIELELSIGDALISYYDKESEFSVIYLVSPTTEDFQKLEKIKGSTQLKFLGDEEVLKGIGDMSFKWCSFVNKIIPKTYPVSILVNIELEKVQVSRSEISENIIKKKVLIVDDSKPIHKVLGKIIEKSGFLEVFGNAYKPSEARAIIEKERPDLITLDINMPEMTGLEFLKTYLGDLNIPVVVISSESVHDSDIIIEALSLGAATFIEKPSFDQLPVLSMDILEKLETIALAKFTTTKNKIINNRIDFSHFKGLIAIGSSTGGTQALQKIFTELPDEIPPIVVVQHIPAVFSKALADRINTLCKFYVKEAEDGEFLEKNTIYIAPGGKQMKLLKRGDLKRVSITDDPPVNRFRPSVDYLFSSIEKLQEKNLLGIILTGMGKDGAQGLLGLKNNGAITLAQDEDSCVVFGMPKEAIRIGGATKVVSLNSIPNQMALEFNKFNKT